MGKLKALLKRMREEQRRQSVRAPCPADSLLGIGRDTLRRDRRSWKSAGRKRRGAGSS